MKDHSIKGGFIEKYFGDGKDRIISFPENMTELFALVDSGELLVDGKAFKVDGARICSWAYRGFSLQHQAGESAALDPEEKAARAAERKEKNAKVKKLLAALAAKGISLDDAEKLI